MKHIVNGKKVVEVTIEVTQVMRYYAEVDSEDDTMEIQDQLYAEGVDWERIDKYGDTEAHISVEDDFDDLDKEEAIRDDIFWGVGNP